MGLVLGMRQMRVYKAQSGVGWFWVGLPVAGRDRSGEGVPAQLSL